MPDMHERVQAHDFPACMFVKLARTREYLLEEREEAERRESGLSYSGVRHQHNAGHPVRAVLQQRR